MDSSGVLIQDPMSFGLATNIAMKREEGHGEPTKMYGGCMEAPMLQQPPETPSS